MAYTYTTLKTAIQDYVQSTETTFVSQLARFILNAEERILKECQLDVFRKSSQGTASSGNAYLAKPSDFLAQNSLSVINGSSKEFLLYKQATMLQDYTPTPQPRGFQSITQTGTKPPSYWLPPRIPATQWSFIIFIALNQSLSPLTGQAGWARMRN
jgi:hypothetical protein